MTASQNRAKCQHSSGPRLGHLPKPARRAFHGCFHGGRLFLPPRARQCADNPVRRAAGPGRMRINGCILAGGRSSRFGSDKALVVWRGKTLLAHAIARLRPQVQDIAVNTNSARAEYRHCGAPIVRDETDAFEGPLAGVLSGLRWASSAGADCLVTAAVDTPLFPGNLVAAFVERKNAFEKQMPALGAAPHPALRATFSPQAAGRRGSSSFCPSSRGEGGAKRRMRGSSEAGKVFKKASANQNNRRP